MFTSYDGLAILRRRSATSLIFRYCPHLERTYNAPRTDFEGCPPNLDSTSNKKESSRENK
jgi:hypothetical protein